MKKIIDNVTIISNNHDYPIIYGFELTDKQKKEFDYMDEETLESSQFVFYKNWLYCFDSFMNLHNKIYEPNPPECFKGWDGYSSDSYFSGVLIKFSNSGDSVKIARYYS